MPTARSIFEKTAPSVVVIETELAVGSGFVYDNSHVVTNAHVVRPYQEADVIFPDGEKLEGVPVLAWDLIGDLAVLQLDLPSGMDPLDLGTSDALVGGDRVYLVGYPRADPDQPEALITEGLLSRQPSTWMETGLRFIQTDAAIDGGQSGGVMLDERGRVVGVTGAAHGPFAIALTIEDVIDRVERMISGEDVDGLEDRSLPDPMEEAPHSVTAEIAHRADIRIWVISADQGDETAMASMTSTGTGFLSVTAAAGLLVAPSGHSPLSEVDIEMDFEPPGPFMLIIEPETRGTFEIESTVGLTSYTDPDDANAIGVGDRFVGVADYAGDLDWLTIELAEGQAITVETTSATVDMVIFIDEAGSESPLVIGSPGPGTVTSHQATFTAERDGVYLIVVLDAARLGAGAYILTVTAGET